MAQNACSFLVLCACKGPDCRREKHKNRLEISTTPLDKKGVLYIEFRGQEDYPDMCSLLKVWLEGLNLGPPTTPKVRLFEGNVRISKGLGPCSEMKFFKPRLQLGSLGVLVEHDLENVRRTSLLLWYRIGLAKFRHQNPNPGRSGSFVRQGMLQCGSGSPYLVSQSEWLKRRKWLISPWSS